MSPNHYRCLISPGEYLALSVPFTVRSGILLFNHRNPTQNVLFPSFTLLDPPALGSSLHTRGRLPGWGVDRRCRPPFAVFLASLDVLHLPAHSVPLHSEVIHPQVLVRCGCIQAEHERWGRADEGGTEMEKPRETRRETDRQTPADGGSEREIGKGDKQGAGRTRGQGLVPCS